MATVFRAEGPEGLVALKILQPGRITTEERKRFEREFLTLQRLDHPNIIRAWRTGTEDNLPYLALQLVVGSDLGSLLDRWFRSPPDDLFIRIEAIFRALCDALAHIHERGIVHRDLKPGNILVSHDGTPHITDFGAVKDTDSFSTSLTMVGRLVGTVAFMAPEQISGEDVDARADLYSLGAVLYNMLTGRRPIIADSIAGYLAQHLSEAPRPPSDLVKGIPRNLERVCLRLLEKDPARRFLSARHVLSSLEGPPSGLLPMHGRAGAQSMLLGLLTALGDRLIGSLLLIEGPSGSGRTRLLHELEWSAKELGLPVLQSLPMDQLIEQATWYATQNLPLVVLVDDLKPGSQLDAGLGLLAGDLLDGIHAPLLLAAVIQGSDSYLEHCQGLVPARLALGPLERDSIRALLRDRGLGGGACAILARRISEELGGLPQTALEQLDALVLAGWLQSGSSGELKPLRAIESFRSEPLPLPVRVREDGARQLERLSPLAKDCLNALAILGTPAPFSLVAALVSASPLQISDALSTLASLKLVKLQGEGIQEEYLLSDSRLRQLVTELLSSDLRTSLHRLAADALARHYQRRPGLVAQSMAHHLAAAGDFAAAWPAYIDAALRALKRGDPAAARSFCQKAAELRPLAEPLMSLLEAARLRRQLYQTLGDALRTTDRFDSAEDAYAQALLAARTEGDKLAQGRALAGSGLVSAARGRLIDATGALEQAVGTLSQGEPLWEEAAGQLALLRIQHRDIEGAQKLVKLLQSYPAGSRMAMEACFGDAILRLASNQPGEVLALTEHLPEPVDARSGEAWIKLVRLRAECLIAKGELEQLAVLADRIEEAGDRLMLASAAPVAAALRVSYITQSPQAAARRARELLQACEVARYRSLWVWAVAIRALVSVADAWDLEATLHETSWPLDLPYDIEAQRLALLALVGRSQGDAWEAANRALLLPPATTPMAAARIELDLAHALARLHDRDTALKALDRAVERLNPAFHRAMLLEAHKLASTIAPNRKLPVSITWE
jgi:tetratricopeptide (TPR) repeat protein